MSAEVEWLNSGNRLPLHAYDVALEVARMYGADALMAVVESLPAGSARAWTRLGFAEISETPEEAKAQAEAALREGMPLDGWRECLNAGADPELFPRQPVDLRALTDEVLSEDIQFHPERFRLWLTEIDFEVCTDCEDSIRQIELRIVPDSWFRKWLIFCLVLARRTSKPHELLESLKQLGEKVEVFKGKPRACDLYKLHDEIRASFRDVLTRLNGDQWVQSIRTLANISSATSTWLMGSRSGPLPLDAMFDLCLETADTAEKRIAASKLAAELLGPEKRSGEFYDTHARDSLLLARIHIASGQRELGEAAWRDACTYLMGYGWRKDITVYEVLDPLEALGKADPIRTRDCIGRMQPIVEGVLVHTDGKETRHAIHKWIDLAASIHPAGALSFLARSEIARLPTFGDLDHAIPKALAALNGQVSQIALAGAWLAAGSEAQSETAAAIEACEKLIGGNNAGNVLWQAVIASLEGDGFEPPVGLGDLANASARRLGLPEPGIESTRIPEKDDHLPHYNPPDTRTLSERLQPTLFTVPKTPLQIASAVRKWRDNRLGRPDANSVINAVGWRILEFIERGDGAAADMVIRRLAFDASSMDRDGLLADLAEGLKIRGHVKLAALTNALAYTSGRDGWLHFGGPATHIRDAIQLDRDLAWSTLADELAAFVALGGCPFTTKRLIELLIANGRIDEAFSCWGQASDVIGSRLPRTGPADDINIAYEPRCDDASSMLAAVIVARINHLFVHEKRCATAAAGLLARYEPQVFSKGLTFAVANEVPPWTLITLLHVLFEFELAPYEATHAAAPDLRSIAVGEFVSARVLARALLDRASLEAPLAPSGELPRSPSISKERASELTQMIGRQRLRRINRLWPEFGKRAVERMDVVYRSDDLRHRMGRTLDRFRLGRKGRRRQVWYPVDEEMERVLQITGAAVRGVLVVERIIDPAVEDEVGMRLLRDTETMVRFVLSRVVRPTYAEQITSKAVGSHVCEPIVAGSGAYKGWVVAGFHETESKVGGLSAVDARITVYSGVVFDDGPFEDDRLPFGEGDPRVWIIGPCQEIPHGPLFGPMSGLQRITDAFGISEILVPHPVLVAIGQLTPVSFDRGLTLVDRDALPSVVCRAWRQRLIGVEYLDDREHRIEGIELLVRADLFTAMSSLALNSPKLLTVVVNQEL